MDNPVVRLTWQMSEQNKVAAYMDRALRLRGHAMGSLTDPKTASVIWNTPTFATGSVKWTSTASSKLLLENGFSFNRERYDNLYQPGILAERGTEAWYRNVRKDDTSTGLLWNASSAQLGNYPDRYNLQSAASYVTGIAQLQGRRDVLSGATTAATTTPTPICIRPTTTARRCRVTVLNTPLEVQENLDANLGVYAQDSWSINRLTLNYGVRWDYVKQRIVGQPASSRPLRRRRRRTTTSCCRCGATLSPRVSVVYDLSGNGKTAVRAGFNKFVTAATTGFAQLYNPTALTTFDLPWSDVNGDDIAQGERGCVFNRRAARSTSPTLPPNFGVRSLAQFDPDLEAAVSAGVQRRHHARSAAGAERDASSTTRSDFKDITMRTNSLRTPDSYDRDRRRQPARRRVIPDYTVKPAFSERGGQHRQHQPGHEALVQRLRPGLQRAHARRACARSAGSTSSARSTTRARRPSAIPNRLLYCDQSESGIPWQKQFKAHGRVSVAVVRHLGERRLAEPERLSRRHGGAGVRRLHGRHRLRPAERSRHVLADHADHALRRQLREPVHARTRWSCRPGCIGAAAQRVARRAGDRVHAAHQPGGFLGEQARPVRQPHASCRSWTSSTRFNSDDYTAVVSTQFGAAPTCGRRWCSRAGSSASGLM